MGEVQPGTNRGTLEHKDRLPKHGAAQNVSDRAVGGAPHGFQAEFLNPFLIWCDGGAFNADAVFLDRLGAIDGDLIVGLVPLFNAQIVVFQVNVQIRQYQFLFDKGPNDPCHFIAVEFDDRCFHFYLAHGVIYLISVTDWPAYYD